MRWKFPKFKAGQTRRWEYLLPTGSVKETESFARKILTDPYLPKTSAPFLRSQGGKLLLENANFRQALEFLVRIPWVRDFRLNLGMYPVKRVLGFEGLEEVLRKSETLPPDWGIRFHPQVKGRNDWRAEDLNRLWETQNVSPYNGVHTTELSALLLEDEIIINLSLAGDPLNQRGGFRPLSKSAPIREDLALFLIRKLRKILPNPDGLFVPFAGTGTLIRESLDSIFGIGFPHYPRKYLFQDLPEFPKPTWDFLRKKILTGSETNLSVWWNEIDTTTFEYTKERMFEYSKFLIDFGLESRVRAEGVQGDFFSFSPAEIWERFKRPKRIWMPLNPPYGQRMEKVSPSAFYKRLGEKLKLWWELPAELNGFLLCPDEETWSVFVQRIGIKTETIHVTHGGTDLRVVYF